MRIIIVGGGVVGSSLAEQLIPNGHQLSLIETDPRLSQILSEKLDVQIITGSGSSPKFLHEAGIMEADMIIAVTPNDEINIVACALAAQYGVGRRIARLRDRVYSEKSKIVDLEKLGITSVIHPEKALVNHVLQFLATPHAVEVADFENGRILFRGYRITKDMAIANKTPLEIRQEIQSNTILFAAIVRDGKGMIPGGDTLILPGDIVYVLFPRESVELFLHLVNVEYKKRRKIIITGDCFSTLELAQALDNTDNTITLVDPDLEHAQKAAQMFTNVQVLHGDCTDVDLLREQNVDSASFFIGISNADDYNMFSTLLAKAEGAREVIAISTETHHDKLFNSIGIDHVSNPRVITAREILEIVTLGQIGAVVQLSDVDIEAVRFTVESGSEIANRQVKKIARKLKRKSIIGMVVRGNKMILPDGETVIEEEDHVIMITRHKNLPPLAKLFKGHL
ncbi:MAG: Trk system potassium transporter TrkA [candidate division Zixibacteria bacterium]|nr:Trk system potassium transporter TrkA [candidate division Zixibacteria bacterium]